MNITADYLRSQVEITDHIKPCLERINTATKLGWFIRCYADWNATFASGVTALTSLIGQERELFASPTAPAAISDRSILIASHIFDAARDEYDDDIMTHRDPHRSLAQATLVGLANITDNQDILHAPEPAWLRAYRSLVIHGYTGGGLLQPASPDGIFAGIGYHLGSELLADQEFSSIDSFMREKFDYVVQKLMRTTVRIHGAEHRCYAWIGIHSGGGGGVEMDHFDAGLDAANLAFSYLNKDLLTEEDAQQALLRGFKQFAAEQQEFFVRTGMLIDKLGA